MSAACVSPLAAALSFLPMPFHRLIRPAPLQRRTLRVYAVSVGTVERICFEIYRRSVRARVSRSLHLSSPSFLSKYLTGVKHIGQPRFGISIYSYISYSVGGGSSHSLPRGLRMNIATSQYSHMLCYHSFHVSTRTRYGYSRRKTYLLQCAYCLLFCA